MELPTYKPPTLKGIWFRTSLSANAFLKRAGTIIFAITVVIWALSYYPHDPALAQNNEEQIASVMADAEAELIAIVQAIDPELSVIDFETGALEIIANSSASEQQAWRNAHENFQSTLARRDAKLNELKHTLSGEYLRQSFFGRMGLTLEPLFTPLGWDWRITMSALASFPAREVVIATLGTVYNLGANENETSTSLVEKLRGATWDSGPKAGQPVYDIAVAMSIMVFFALCCQCGATLAVIRRETRSWKWAAFTFTYMTVLAYVSAWAAYRITLAVVL